MSAKFPYKSAMFPVLGPDSTWGMTSQDQTMADVLRSSGYQTHATGKWHLGMAWNDYLPTFRGFQTFLGCWGVGFHFNHSTGRAGDVGSGYNLVWHKQEFCGWNCTEFPDFRGKYSSHVFTDRATEVIQNLDTEQGPLFLYLAYQAVHRPLEVPESYTEPYNSTGWPDEKIVYAGMLATVDEGIAKVIQSLKDKGIWEETLLIVTTDNGAGTSSEDGHRIAGGSNSPLKGGKLSIQEGGIRADGIIAGPARATLGIQGGNNPHLFHAMDWLPTLASLVQANYKPSEFDGISQRRSLLKNKPSREEVFLGYDVRDYPLAKSAMRSAYRIGDMKLVRWRKGTEMQYRLYNLTQDIGESTDLIENNEYRSLVATMRKKLRGFDFMFPKEPEKLGYCPNVYYGTTPWGQDGWVPFCEAGYSR